MKLHGGVPWKYMYTHIFPELRGASTGARIEYYKEEPDTVALPFIPEVIEAVDTVPVPSMPVPVVPAIPVDTVIPLPVQERKPFYMAVKTNMLYDAFLVPNIGVEFYLGDYWSVGANWMYAWWHSNRHHNYWRTYGGDLEVRRWFGSKADEKPLTGHHVGVYGQMLTYDFELGGRGYLGDRWSWGVGVSYGYSLPVAKRLNIDFTIGIGYLRGEYKEYKPIDGCYVWQATKMRNWIGPTKAEISLVWLIGHKNYNEKKGGAR